MGGGGGRGGMKYVDTGIFSSDPFCCYLTIAFSPCFDQLQYWLGKYESVDEHSLAFYQNNTSAYNTMENELILIQYADLIENELKSVQKVPVNIR